jgi:hypothetical protein
VKGGFPRSDFSLGTGFGFRRPPILNRQRPVRDNRNLNRGCGVFIDEGAAETVRSQ